MSEKVTPTLSENLIPQESVLVTGQGAAEVFNGQHVHIFADQIYIYQRHNHVHFYILLHKQVRLKPNPILHG